MALNVTFTCNNIVDENNNPINCKYQAYFPDYGVWNNVRTSEFFQYNCNAGDGDALTQTGTLLDGDYVILAFWDGQETRSGLQDRMAYYIIQHDGVTNTYVIDVQLKPKTAPSCGWSLTTSATINRTVTAYTTASDNYQWDYNGKTMYHRERYGQEVIFDSIGDLIETYDFGAGDGYSATNTYSYSTIGDYIVHHKVINEYSLESVCDKNIRLKYNTPIAGLSFNPDGYGTGDEVSVGDSVSINANITDEDSRITNIEHSFIIKNRNNNSTIIRDTLYSENTNLNYSYAMNILELHDTFGNQVIHWNDGWEDQTVYYNRELPITNILPEVSISKTDLSAKEKRFTQISNDADGTVVAWSWKIYLLMPFSGEWVEVYQTSNDGSDINIQFNEAGRYKAEITVTDDFNKFSTKNNTVYGSASAEIEFDITPSGSTTCAASLQDDIFFIFPDVAGDGICCN
jgi:hypothetical protein